MATRAEYNRAYYLANRDRIQARRVDNREGIREQQAAYTAAHRVEKAARNRRNYAAAADARRAYSRRYYSEHRDERAAYRREYHRTEHGQAVMRAYANDHPQEERARGALATAVWRGRVVRGPCVVCGNPMTQGHHHNGYDRLHYLDVTWLCGEHHREAHRELRSAAK